MAIRKSEVLLPNIFQTERNRKFLNATVDQLISEPERVKINSFVGRVNSKNFVAGDSYVQEINKERQNYQLEPGVVYRDAAGTIETVDSYIDTLNRIKYYGGRSDNQTKLFEQEYYNWSGFVDIDKLVNYGEYFWLPGGPDAVNIFSGEVELEKTYTVNRGSDSYTFDTDVDENPTIYLARGGTYEFSVAQSGTPFWIQTEVGLSGTSTIQDNISTREIFGVTNNGDDNGTITFEVPSAIAQENFTGMTFTGEVDLVSKLVYTQVHGVSLDDFLDTHGGIDGLTEIDGKTLIFFNDSDNAADWGPWDLANRYDIFRINIDSDSTSSGIIELIRVQDFPVDTKVTIKQGVEYGNRDFYKKTTDQKTALIPPITANLETYYYQDGDQADNFGKIVIVDTTGAIDIDVENEILGKTSYTSPNGVEFTNGLKVKFDRAVTPAEFAEKEFYVEGVGSAITLHNTELFVTPEPYSENESERFDTLPFDTLGFDGEFNRPVAQDYIVVNRASLDRSAWSRVNRWFHRSVIEATNEYNDFIGIIDENQRAKRPIIEFLPNLKLFNMAESAVAPVSVFDTVTTDAFSQVNGETGYFSDGVDLTPGLTVIFSADPDVKDKIYRVEKIDQDNDANTAPIINLIEIGTVSDNQSTLSIIGNTNQGVTFTYSAVNGWTRAQQKTRVNQAPLFDVFDAQGVSFSDSEKYPSSSFVGSRLFGYKANTSAEPDSILGFGISFKNFGTIGDIVFSNDFVSDVFTVVKNNELVEIVVKSGKVKQSDAFLNGWTKVLENSKQYQIVQHVVDTELYSFEIGLDPKEDFTVSNLQVFVNNEFQPSSRYTVLNQTDKDYVIFNNPRTPEDVVTIKVYSDSINPLGFYEIPANLENNANNSDFDEATLGQMRNHLVEIAQSIPEFTGRSLGQNNLRDIDYNKYPGKILQHSAGNILPTYLLNNTTADIISATAFCMEEYTRFKNRFLDQFEKLDIDLRSPAAAVDLIIEELAGSKTDAFPFFYSDMIPWGNQKSISSVTIDDASERRFNLSEQFDLTEISQRGVIIYINKVSDNSKTQLVEGVEYTLDSDEPAFDLAENFILAVGDVIEIHEYTNTDGSFVPPTPTKLGLWPKTAPEYLLEENFSITVNETGPYKVFGTTDPEYTQPAAGLTGFWYPLYTTKSAAEARDTELGGTGSAHAHRFIGTDKLFWMPVSDNYHGVQDNTDIDLYPALYPIIRGHDGSKWVGFGDIRDLVLLEYERRVYNNIKTQYNEQLFDWSEIISGYWRSTVDDFKDDLNTLRRFYGAWTEKNRVNQTENTTSTPANNFTWNYKNGVEKLTNTRIPGGWRGIYKWMYDTETPHLTPWEMLGLASKPTWWDGRYGAAPYTSGNQILWEDLRDGKVYSDAIGSSYVIKPRYARPRLLEVIPVTEQGRLKAPGDFMVAGAFDTNVSDPWAFGDYSPQETAWRNSSEWPFAVQILAMVKKPSKYLTLMFDTNLYEKNTQFDQILQKFKTYRPTLNDYKIHGVIERDTQQVNRVEGYNQFLYNYLMFNNFQLRDTQTRIQNLELNLVYKLAGYTDKTFLKVVAENATPASSNESVFIPDENYEVFLSKSAPLERVFYSGVKIIKVANGYQITGYDVANPFFKIVPSVKGSNTTAFAVGDDENFFVFNNFQRVVANIPYGTVYRKEQQVVDFLISYQRYLNNRGITFASTNEDGSPKDFVMSAKEFVFWSKQNWNVGSAFTVSPAYDELTVDRPFTTTDDFSQGITIRNANGQPVRSNNYKVDRIDNKTVVRMDTTKNLLYSATLDPIQYEHVLVFDNTTIFNDVIYQPELGNRQERVKLIGSKVGDWNGTLHAPGFIVSQDRFNLWQANQDYRRGDYVSFRNKIWVAAEDHSGTTTFEFENWKEAGRIRTGLLQNPAARADSFENFFNIDDLNLESGTDKAGKGLIGFRNRSYLENLGLDDVSQVKFYQGMIKSKGTPEIINKLINANLTNLDQNIEFFEEWGFRIGEYGSIDSNQVIEFKINEQTTQEDPIVVEFLNDGDIRDATRETFIEQELYKVPRRYNKNIFSTRDANTRRLDINLAGHPRLDDVDFTLFDVKNYQQLNQDLTNIGRGKKVWIARDTFGSIINENIWNVARVSETLKNVIAAESASNDFVVFKTDSNHNLSINDIVVLKTDEDFSGVYKVEEIPSPTTFVVASDLELDFTEENSDLQVPLYKLERVRFAQPSDISTFTPILGWENKEIVWVDKNQNNRWAAYQKQSPWNETVPKETSVASASSNLGSSVSIASDGLTAVSGAPGGNKFIPYVRPTGQNFVESFPITVDDVSSTISDLGASVSVGKDLVVVGAPGTNSSKGLALVYARRGAEFTLLQVLYDDSISTGAQFGTQVKVSDDDKYVFVGAPGANRVYTYALRTVTTVDEKSSTEVGDGTTTVFTLSFVPDSADSINVVDGNGKLYLPGKDYTVSGDQITFTTAPISALNIVVRQQTHYVSTGSTGYVSGSDSTTADQFGFDIDIDRFAQTLVVGAPNADVVDASSTTYADAGQAYAFSHNIEEFFGTGTQTAFTTTTTLSSQIFVEVGGELKTELNSRTPEAGEDSTIYDYEVSGNTVTFFEAPADGSVVRIYTGVYTEMQKFNQDVLTGQTPVDNENFGYSVAIDPSGSVVAVGAPGEDELNPNTGSVFVYFDAGLRYGEVSTDSADGISITSGDSIFINNKEVTITGTATDVSGIVDDINDAGIVNVTASQGATSSVLTIQTQSIEPNSKVRIRPGAGSSYATGMNFAPFRIAQKINHPSLFENENFGQSVEFDRFVPIDRDITQNLLITSTRSSTLLRTLFDLDSDETSVTFGDELTTFDIKGIKFIDRVTQSGSVYVYELLNAYQESETNPAKYAYVQQLTSIDIDSNDEFGSSVSYYNSRILVGSPSDAYFNTAGGSVYEYVNPQRSSGWNLLREENDKVDVEVINRIVSYNSRTNKILSFVDYIDPFKRKVAGIAEDEIDYITSYDPATYTIASGRNDQNPKNPWNDEYIGRVWWDLETVSSIEYEQGDLDYRTNFWGTFFPGSSIDVYEWVQSEVLPSQYVDNGGEGIPKHPDDSNYSQSQIYNPSTDTTETRYFFWVKNKTSVPDVGFRNISTSRVASIIEDPKANGIKYAEIIAPNAVSLVNLVDDLEDNNTVFSINYDVVKNNGVLHSEFDLVAEGDSAQVIPARLYQKLVDSLAGQDSQGNAVPNPFLSDHEKYGVLIRPRQGLFVNRFGAMKVFVDYCNQKFLERPLARQVNLANNLLKEQAEPTISSGEWNERVENIVERDFLNTLILPTGYKVLVGTDETQKNRWTIYELQADDSWFLTRIQSFVTSDQWSFVTWYDTGFDEFTVPLYQVNTEADLLRLNATTGEVAKVLSNDDGNFSFFELQSSGSWREVIIEQGTIQFNTSLYSTSGIGFDAESFDLNEFDSIPVAEVRNLFTAVRDDIFINELAINFNELFFRLIEYALYEQNDIIGHPDWVIKTSFIKVLHKLRDLTQYPTFRNDNEQFVEDFINEVKAYKTKIREYIAAFNGNDSFEGDITDFDIHSYFDETLQLFRKPNGESPGDATLLAQGLNKPWNDNYGYYLDELIIYSGGTGYTTDPTITISAPELSGGVQATATAVSNSTAITRVTITNPGSGYITTPTVTVTGTGTGAIIIPRIKNDTTRDFDITIKLDRITYGTVVQDWAPNTTYAEGDIVSYTNPVTGIAEAYEVVATSSFTTGDTFEVEDDTGELALQIYADENFDASADRIGAYYTPTAGMLGDDLALVQRGTAYPGVQVLGPAFSDDPGFDVSAFDTRPFDNIEFDSDGIAVLAGANSLDTIIQSEFLDLALGTRPEDIDIEGGGFVDTYSSHAPEELIPGRVFDTLDMEVYTDPSNDEEYDGNSFEIELLSHVGDGVTDTFAYASDAQSDDLDNVRAWIGTIPQRDFDIDYENRTVTFTAPPASGDIVYLYSYGTTGEQITSENTFTGDGSTTTYELGITDEFALQTFVRIDGQRLTEGADFTTSANLQDNGVNITFAVAPADQSHIHVFTSSVTATKEAFTEMYTQEITLVSGVTTYSMERTSKFIWPYEGNSIVELSGLRLRPSNSKYYTGDGSTAGFLVPNTAGETAALPDSDILVSVIPAEKPLDLFPQFNKVQGVDYTVDPSDGSSTRSITFTQAPESGATVIVSVKTNADYTIDVATNTITLDPSVSFASGTKLYLTTFTNHDPLRIHTKVFEGLGSEVATVSLGFDGAGFDDIAFDETTTTGVAAEKYTLDRVPANLNYLWVTVNGVKLHPGEFNITSGGQLDLTGQGINSSSIVVVTHFSEDVIKPTTGFRIFQGMLGDVNYYRLSYDASTILARDLNYDDTVIYVEDASVLPDTSPASKYPGVIFIGTERITYWDIDTSTNTITNIRRGTAGTGWKELHTAGTRVLDSSIGQQMPQTDSHTKVWYTPGDSVPADGRGLQNSTTVNAQFLLEGEARVPVFPE